MSASPGSVRGHVSALLHLRRHDDAVRAARGGLAVEPDDPELTLLLALALCNSGDHRHALPVARRAVALRPDDPVAHRTLGWVLLNNGRGAQAANHLAHALSLDPYDPATHALRAEMLLLQAQRTNGIRWYYIPLTAEAEQHAAEVVRLNPAAAAGYLLHATACLVRADAVGAETWARKALSLEPDHPRGHEILGKVAQLQGEPTAAAEHFLSAGRIEPRSRAPVKLLQRLRTGPVDLFGRPDRATRVRRSVAFVVAFVIVAVVCVAVGAADRAGPFALLAAACVALVHHAVQRWKARHVISADARRALTRDRKLRGCRWRGLL
jgi:Flp pilus assembly protein TadD